ncbi:unnamed protein product [Rotaria socialis]|uniref:Alpha/beta hydrolase fold-3 domain-containing protein n=1 Tax=Rotaria socialis TaxID=392032 RepID=A0A818AWW7_9BILA|nr:unnamed protein product [Rotaria socialis]CAF3603474.1 unnamed protein product [Rotaria socialis]CAF4523674.1 unnamed protein product [Rotaria socialis]CAF4554155.1 unnamed protein product [Rotaria socialis]
MACSNCCYSLIKNVTLLIVMLAIGIPLYYNSTNPLYLQIRVIHSLISIKHMLVPDAARPKLTAEYRAFEGILGSFKSIQYDPMMDPLERVKQMRASFSFGKTIPRSSECRFKKELFKYEERTAEAYWINNLKQENKWETDQILLYFHGGGYMLGDFQAYSGFECHISRLFNMTVIHLEYSRVPEHPLPAAVKDAVTLYGALLQQGISSSRLAIMGDSAGGGLALLTIQAILNRQLPKPRAAALVSPWTDLSSSGESFKRNRVIDVLLNSEHIPWMIDQALGPNRDQLARDDPIFSPLFGSFNDFPPLYIVVGTAEILEDDSRRVVDKARSQNVDVTFEVGEHLMHVYPLFFFYFREARDTLENIRQWFEGKF